MPAKRNISQILKPKPSQSPILGRLVARRSPDFQHVLSEPHYWPMPTVGAPAAVEVDFVCDDIKASKNQIMFVYTDLPRPRTIVPSVLNVEGAEWVTLRS